MILPRMALVEARSHTARHFVTRCSRMARPDDAWEDKKQLPGRQVSAEDLV